jgi:RNA polymerase sigma factor (sigma-70 family)
VTDYHRACCRDQGLIERLISWAHNGKCDGEGPDPVRLAVLRDELRHACKAMAALTEQERSILGMRVFGELSYSEIAEVMDMSTDAVGVTLHRAKKHLAAATNGNDEQSKETLT